GLFAYPTDTHTLTSLAAGNVAIAVGDGARTGGAAHHSLLFR
ncbi:hypothetical protein, partial [Pseudomonas aeruginosa]